MLRLNSKSKIILASESPRRSYLLMQAGVTFTVVPSSFDETTVSISSPESYVKILAEGKALEVSKRNPDHWVIGADTIVLINESILGKPESKQHARNMIQLLNGNTHSVITGYCICSADKNRLFSDVVSTEVTFKHLSEKEIEWYIHTDEPYDKAGAYAIQERGSLFVKKINGSYSNVVGLPVCEIIDILLKEHILNLEI